MTLSSRIAEFVSGLEAEALPDVVVERLQWTVMDCLAAMLAGLAEPVSKSAIQYTIDHRGNGQATLIGHGLHVSPVGAAFANGVMAHACDYDDTSFTMCGHPTATVLPAVLAVAETRGLSGRETLAALAAGLEVGIKLGTSASFRQFQAGWHPTATFGTLGAAAGAARALGLQPNAVANALGIAATRAAGVRANIGSMTKPLHVGFAASNGLEAAMLAAEGITASPSAIDGPFGFFNSRLKDSAPGEDLASCLGNSYEVADPGLTYKRYPCCGDTHSAADAVLSLYERPGFDADAVDRVCCIIPPGCGGDLVYHDPKTPSEAKFSMEYCVASAVVRGRLGLADFEPEAVGDAAVRRLMPRVETVASEDLLGPGVESFLTPARVELHLAGGDVLEETVMHMRGHPENPMTREEFEAKYRAAAERVLDARTVDASLAGIKGLAAAAEVGRLMRSLALARGTA